MTLKQLRDTLDEIAADPDIPADAPVKYVSYRYTDGTPRSVPLILEIHGIEVERRDEPGVIDLTDTTTL